MRNPRERLAALRRERSRLYDQIDSLDHTIREFEVILEPKKFVAPPRFPKRMPGFHNTGVPDCLRHIFTERNEGKTLYVPNVMAMIWDVPKLTKVEHARNLQNLRNTLSKMRQVGELQKVGHGGHWKK